MGPPPVATLSSSPPDGAEEFISPFLLNRAWAPFATLCSAPPPPHESGSNAVVGIGGVINHKQLVIHRQLWSGRSRSEKTTHVPLPTSYCQPAPPWSSGKGWVWGGEGGGWVGPALPSGAEPKALQKILISQRPRRQFWPNLLRGGGGGGRCGNPPHPPTPSGAKLLKGALSPPPTHHHHHPLPAPACRCPTRPSALLRAISATRSRCT